MLHAMIMAGGGGTRFWPRSRERRPKQFLCVTGERTLLQMALDRVEAQIPPERCWVVTAAAYVDETRRQLPTLPASQVVGEPARRDTAAAIALGAALIAAVDADAVMAVTPADHVIEPVQEFRRALYAAAQTAQERPEALVTFGIPPTYPATGYGYIHRGGAAGERQGLAVHAVRGFREKPTADIAERYVVSGEYLWNSGIFVWRAATILDALRRLEPEVHAAVTRVAAAWPTKDRDAVLTKEFAEIKRISIDYAVMERAAEAGKEVLVLPAPYRWDDVGSWLAVERMNPQDADGNTVLSPHQGVRTKNCVVAGEAGRLIATLGVEDLIIVQDGDATLVAHRREEAAVKEVVETLRQRGREGSL